MNRIQIFFRLKTEEIRKYFLSYLSAVVVGLITGISIYALDFYCIIDIYTIIPKPLYMDIVLCIIIVILSILIIHWLITNWIKAGKIAKESDNA